MSVIDGIGRILVPVDGSECSRHAAEQAVRLARTHAAELVFLHVVDTQVVEQLAQQGGGDDFHARDRLFANGQVYLDDVARLAAAHGIPHREEIAEGDPCTVICDAAARVAADLVVMGRIGRRGARRILVGSITRRVIESSERPVLVVTGPPAGPSPEHGA
jgi:nucleotide-binding universal stress UspA family protein